MRTKLREKRVGVRLSGEELAKVEAVAAQSGVSLSECVRLMIRGSRVKSVAAIEIQLPQTNQRVTA